MYPVRSVLLFAVLLLGFPALLVACWLVVAGQAPHSQAFGLAVVLGWLAALAWLRWCLVARGDRKVIVVAGSLLSAGAAIALLGSWFASPKGTAPEGSAYTSVRTDGSYWRLSPTNLVAERDQLALGNQFFRYADQLMTSAKAERLAGLLDRAYDGMDRDLVALGSDFGGVYWDIAGWRQTDGHAYVYIPPGAKQPMPAFVFLHGSMGNFKAYLWALRTFADAEGVAIVAPSFGIGNWWRPGGLEATRSARDFCDRDPRLDGTRVVLGGLSAGGLGVMQAVRIDGTRYAGFVLISAVIVKAELDAMGRSSARVLVVHGDCDERVPFGAAVAPRIVEMRAKGMAVTEGVFAGEDHFLILSDREGLARELGRFFDGAGMAGMDARPDTVRKIERLFSELDGNREFSPEAIRDHLKLPQSEGAFGDFNVHRRAESYLLSSDFRLVLEYATAAAPNEPKLMSATIGKILEPTLPRGEQDHEWDPPIWEFGAGDKGESL